MTSYIRNYEVLRQLGEGHFGMVYVAVGEVPGRGLSASKRRLVAIKQLRTQDPHHVQLLEREFELLDEVKHRGIVRVFEFLADENAVVMEYVHGVTLRKLLDECGRAREQVFTEAAIELICELADALYQAWTTPSDNGEALQLVHRDLKPENIMVTPKGEVKILDFGLARVDNREYRPEDNDRIKGTPVYMAPEQARGDEVDHRSDLFSLGLIAYELFMNKPAYTLPVNSPDPLAAIFDAIERGALHKQCRELETKVPGVGGIIARLLAPNPRDRYQTGQDLLVDLRRQLYRDRSSHLEEFSEFFFGSIYSLADAPDPDGPRQGNRRVSSSGSRKRMSMEERLRASMAREATARQEAEKPSTWRAPPRPAARPKAPPPPPSTPAPVRRPDGMLEMRGLDEDFGGAIEEDEGSGATAFFALPTPKETARPAAPAPAPAPAPRATPVQPSMAPPPPPPPHAGHAPTPIAQGPIAQGPVAAYSSQPGPAYTPDAPPPPPPPAEHAGRTESTRVAAIIIAMFLLLGGVAFIAIWVKPWEGSSTPDRGGEIVTNPSSGQSGGVADARRDPPDEPEVRQLDDTGSVEVPETRPPRDPKPSNTNPGPRINSGGSAAANSAPKVGKGTLVVNITSDATLNTVQLTCSGHRDRKSVTGSSVSFSGVPSSGCTLIFSGSTKATFNGVGGGQSLKCQIQGSNAVCK